MTNSARVVDTNLTAGQAALWGGMMTNEMLLPVIPLLDRAGYDAIEVLDPFIFGASVERLGEDPWERLRLVANRLTRTPAAASIAGRYLWGREEVPGKAARRVVTLLAHHGLGRLCCYDPLNDVLSMRDMIEEARDAGLAVFGGIVFALDEDYTEEYFCSRARLLAELGCSGITVLDFSGTFHPECAERFVPPLRTAIGDLPLEIRTQCRSGRAELACFMSLERGANVVHAASDALSGGDSVPSIDFFAEHLGREGFASPIERDAVASIRDYFEGVRDFWNLPRASVKLYDADVDRHQVPVELESTLEEWCESFGRARFLAEVAAVRANSGHPPMAFPVARWLCEHAARNLAEGTPGTPYPLERARRVSALEDFSTAKAVTASHFSDDVLRRSEHLAENVDRTAWDISARTPLELLAGELERRSWVRQLRVSSGSFVFEAAAR